jgi:Uma2 family endonuclease
MTTTSDRLDAVQRADHVPGPRQGAWTYAHYAALPSDGQRYELLDGVLYMAPAPNLWHQDIVGTIYVYLYNHVKLTGLGMVYVAPVDVELAPQTVVQPDVVVVRRDHTAILHPTRIIGTPDLVVEVASPVTEKYDRQRKRNAYARAAIPEYWLVDPVNYTLEILVLESRQYHSTGPQTGHVPIQSTIVSAMADVFIEQLFV